MRHFSIYLSLWMATCYVFAAEEQQKRAPSGFTGVRGKKSIPDEAYTETTETADGVSNDLNDVVADVTYVEKRAPLGFLGMRGKKPFDGWIREDSGELYKRAPSGFMGMRGKKELNYDNDYDKRVPSGFFGMRGKKTYDDDDLYLDDKRAPSGFFGMRGKKDYEDEMDEIKRAFPENRFFGMRGKKQPVRSSFFGMRGKKYPYEFRGKFVGVRGKKSSGEISSPVYLSNSNNAYDSDFLRSYDDLDLDQLMRLLTANERIDDFQNQKADGYLAQQQI